MQSEQNLIDEIDESRNSRILIPPFLPSASLQTNYLQFIPNFALLLFNIFWSA